MVPGLDGTARLFYRQVPLLAGHFDVLTFPLPDDAKAKFARRRVPLRRYGQPEEVAHATLAFVLPAASFTNGAVLLVDGGFSIQN